LERRCGLTNVARETLVFKDEVEGNVELGTGISEPEEEIDDGFADAPKVLKSAPPSDRLLVGLLRPEDWLLEGEAPAS
jgi:hypothetical protein